MCAGAYKPPSPRNSIRIRSRNYGRPGEGDGARREKSPSRVFKSDIDDLCKIMVGKKK